MNLLKKLILMSKKFIFLGIRLEALESFCIFFNLKYVITVKGCFVHKYCKKKKIKYMLINKKNKLKIFDILMNEKECDIICSAGFPYILPYKILKNYKIKINSHPSLLPNYKGVSPIKAAFRKREKKYGVTLHNMIEKVDSGNIIYQDHIKLNNIKLKNLYQIIFKILEPFVIIRGIYKIKL